MTERQPDKVQMGLVAAKMGWTLVEQLHPVRIPVGTCKICSTKPCALIAFPATGETLFDPLHDHNDLARFVEAMVKAGYVVVRTRTNKNPRTEVFEECKDCSMMLDRIALRNGTDLAATFWACIEALEKEKQDADG